MSDTVSAGAPGVCVGCGGALVVDVRARHALIDSEGVGKRCVFCSRIDVDNQTIGQVYDQLRVALAKACESFEGMACCVDWYASTPEHARSTLAREKPAEWVLTRESPFPQGRWIACYAVTGASEGHYVHVDVVVDHGRDRFLVHLFQAKTFGGRDEAQKIAATCAELLGA